MRTSGMLPVSVALLLLAAGAVVLGEDGAGTGLISVEAEGLASVIDGDVPQARDEAIEDAKVKAVEQVVGTYVDSETILENELLLSTMVRCSSAGYVRNVRPIKEHQDENGLYRVRIEAWVQPTQLREGVAEELRSNESLVVLLKEKIDGEGLAPPIVTDRLTEELVNSGFRVIDYQHAALLRERDRLIAAARGDEVTADEIGLRFLAGVIITGNAKARFSQNNEGIISSMGSGSVKAIESDTAKTVAMASLRRVKGFALDKYQAGEKALIEVGRQLVEEKSFVDRLIRYVGRTERELQIEVGGLPERADATRFVNFLNALRWVQEPAGESFSPEQSVFTVRYAQPTVFLATRIDRRPEYRVLQYSWNRIVVETVPEEQ